MRGAHSVGPVPRASGPRLHQRAAESVDTRAELLFFSGAGAGFGPGADDLAYLAHEQRKRDVIVFELGDGFGGSPRRGRAWDEG